MLRSLAAGSSCICCFLAFPDCPSHTNSGCLNCRQACRPKRLKKPALREHTGSFAPKTTSPEDDEEQCQQYLDSKKPYVVDASYHYSGLAAEILDQRAFANKHLPMTVAHAAGAEDAGVSAWRFRAIPKTAVLEPGTRVGMWEGEDRAYQLGTVRSGPHPGLMLIRARLRWNTRWAGTMASPRQQPTCPLPVLSSSLLLRPWAQQHVLRRCRGGDNAGCALRTAASSPPPADDGRPASSQPPLRQRPRTAPSPDVSGRPRRAAVAARARCDPPPAAYVSVQKELYEAEQAELQRLRSESARQQQLDAGELMDLRTELEQLQRPAGPSTSQQIEYEAKIMQLHKKIDDLEREILSLQAAAAEIQKLNGQAPLSLAAFRLNGKLGARFSEFAWFDNIIDFKLFYLEHAGREDEGAPELCGPGVVRCALC